MRERRVHVDFEWLLRELAECQGKKQQSDAAQKRFVDFERRMKLALLSGAVVERGQRTVMLRLREGRREGGRDPDDYDLVVESVQ